MTITKEQIINAVSEMSITEVMELVSMMEKKFGISAKSNILSNSNNKPSEDTEEKTSFNVILNSIGSNKIAVIKIIRNIMGLGLKESKDLVESSPVVIKENINKEDADKIKKCIEETGASVEIK